MENILIFLAEDWVTVQCVPWHHMVTRDTWNYVYSIFRQSKFAQKNSEPSEIQG